MQRRDFLKQMCAGGIATFGAPVVRFAHVPEPGNLVFVLLRGGFDGLAAVVPIGDPSYAEVRGAMSYSEPDVIALERGFSLAPGLRAFKEFWDRDELVVLHGMAIPFRTRSHFDGQAVLETGLNRPEGSSDGWLNRLLQVMEGERTGIAVAAGMPRSFQGAHPVSTWSPAQLGAVDDAYIERLHLLYRADRTLFNRFEAAIQQQEIASEMSGAARGRRPGNQVDSILRAAAKLIRQTTGPNVAAVEFSGWDTHANQGLAGGALDRQLAQLAAGLQGFREELGSEWTSTTVVVMTEFGRTARPNGTRGTDHGTGGAGFVLGPRVSRSRVVADWPGLGDRDLYEGRDLRPTLDTRSVLKGVLSGTFDLTASQVERVFPASSDVAGMIDLMM